MILSHLSLVAVVPTTSRNSYLVFLQGTGSLWSRNGWVSANFNPFIFCIDNVFIIFVARSTLRLPEVKPLQRT